MGLIQVFSDVLGINSRRHQKGPPPRPIRNKLNSGTRLKETYVPTRTESYILFSSQVFTVNRRSTSFDPIQRNPDGSYDIVPPIKIGTTDDDLDLFSTGILEKIMRAGYGIWVIIDEMDTDASMLTEMGIPSNHILDSMEYTGDDNDSLNVSYAVKRIAKSLQVDDMLPAKPPSDPCVLLRLLAFRGIRFVQDVQTFLRVDL